MKTFMLRLPDELHTKLKVEAIGSSITLHEYIIQKLTSPENQNSNQSTKFYNKTYKDNMTEKPTLQRRKPKTINLSSSPKPITVAKNTNPVQESPTNLDQKYIYSKDQFRCAALQIKVTQEELGDFNYFNTVEWVIEAHSLPPLVTNGLTWMELQKQSSHTTKHLSSSEFTAKMKPGYTRLSDGSYLKESKNWQCPVCKLSESPLEGETLETHAARIEEHIKGCSTKRRRRRSQILGSNIMEIDND